MARWQFWGFSFSSSIDRLNLLTIGLIGILSLSIEPASTQAQIQVQIQIQDRGQTLAQAQSAFSDSELDRYARAIVEIETKRQQVYSNAKKLPDWSVAANRAENQGIKVCDLKKEELPGSIQNMCSNLSDFSQQVIRKHEFQSNADFNKITRTQQQDNQLQRRIQTKIMDLTRSK